MTATKTDRALTVERGHLIQALAQVSPATVRSSLPSLAGVRLTHVGADRLRVTATDLEIWVSCTIPATVDEPFDVVVSARLLQKVIREAHGELRFSVAGAALQVEWGRTVASLHTLPLDDYPRHRAVEGTRYTLTAADLAVIRRIANFASTDWARPVLTSIKLGGDDQTVAATDSYRLAVGHIESALPPTPFLLPAKTVRFLPPQMLPTEEAVLTFGEDQWVSIKVGEVEIMALDVAGEFPSYQRLIPAGTPAAVTFGRADLAKAVRTAGTILETHEPVRILLGSSPASIEALSEERGHLATTVDVIKTEGTTPPATCAFNPRYLGDLLATCSAETVTLEITDHLKPVVVREGPWTLLIMPVRVS